MKKKIIIFYLLLLILPLLISCEKDDNEDKNGEDKTNNSYDVIIDDEGYLAWRKASEGLYQKLDYIFMLYNQEKMVINQGVNNQKTVFTFEDNAFYWQFVGNEQKNIITTLDKVNSLHLSLLNYLININFKINLSYNNLQQLLNGEEINGLKILGMNYNNDKLTIVFKDCEITLNNEFINLSKNVKVDNNGKLAIDNLKSIFDNRIEKYQLSLDGQVYNYYKGQVVNLPTVSNKGNYVFTGWYDSSNQKYETVTIIQNLSLTSKFDFDLSKGNFIRYYVNEELVHIDFVEYNQNVNLLGVFVNNNLISDWYYDKELTKKVQSANLTFTEELNLYAVAETEDDELITHDNYEVKLNSDGYITWQEVNSTEKYILAHIYELYTTKSITMESGVNGNPTLLTFDNKTFYWQFVGETVKYDIVKLKNVNEPKLTLLYYLIQRDYNISLSLDSIVKILNGIEINGIQMLDIIITDDILQFVFKDKTIEVNKLYFDSINIIQVDSNHNYVIDGITTIFKDNYNLPLYMINLMESIDGHIISTHYLYEGQILSLSVLNSYSYYIFDGWYDENNQKYETIVASKDLSLEAKYVYDFTKGNFINYYVDGVLCTQEFKLFNTTVYPSNYTNGETIISIWYFDDKLENRVIQSFTFQKEVNVYSSSTLVLSCAEDSTQSKCQDPALWDWNYNRVGYDGKKAMIKLLHGAPEEINPDLADYSGTQKREKQLQIYEIERSYNIDLVIEKFPDEAAWGPDRVKWINDLAAANIKNKGDIFEIDSDWIPSLVAGKSIAELETVKITNKQYIQNGGVFSELNYTQSQEKLKQYALGRKIYGYSVGDVHADFFLYYNQDLVYKYDLEDPATLWNEGKWDWNYFVEYLEKAQTAFNQDSTGMFAFGGWVNEVVRGSLAARGGKFVDPLAQLVLFTHPEVIQMYFDLKAIKDAGYWADQNGDVCPLFKSGLQLMQPAQLWFLSSDTRFANSDPLNPNCDFQISVVPYPTAAGDGSAKAKYSIPMGVESGYAIRQVGSDEGSLTKEVLFNILDDFCRGIQPIMNITNLTEEEKYRVSLEKMISSEASVDAIMSVETNLGQYGYTDYLDVLSKSVGNGSDWQGDGFYTWGLRLLNDDIDIPSELASHQENYQNKLNEILNA